MVQISSVVLAESCWQTDNQPKNNKQPSSRLVHVTCLRADGHVEGDVGTLSSCVCGDRTRCLKQDVYLCCWCDDLIFNVLDHLTCPKVKRQVKGHCLLLSLRPVMFITFIHMRLDMMIHVHWSVFHSLCSFIQTIFWLLSKSLNYSQCWIMTADRQRGRQADSRQTGW